MRRRRHRRGVRRGGPQEPAPEPGAAERRRPRPPAAHVDWRALYGDDGTAARLELPTYAFRHRRFWLPTPARTGDAGGLGQAPWTTRWSAPRSGWPDPTACC
ncbi:hypothetical protein NKH77_06005 [Streptomyces sp. M19]